MVTEKTVSPKGELQWVNITGEGKENLSGKLQYVADLVLSGPAAEEYKKELEAFWKSNRPKGFKKAAKSMGYYPHTTKTDETDEEGKPIYEETGKTVFKFKTGTTYASGDTKVIKTYNSKAKSVELGEVKIGNGSIGQVSGAIGTYETRTPNGKTLVDAGVTLYLDAIKISKLVEFTQDASFDADEDEDEDNFSGVEDEWEGEPESKSASPRL